MTSVPRDPQYEALSVERVLKADPFYWFHFAKQCRKGILLLAGSITLPVLQSFVLNAALALPVSTQSSLKRSRSSAPPVRDSKNKRQRQAQKNARRQETIAQLNKQLATPLTCRASDTNLSVTDISKGRGKGKKVAFVHDAFVPVTRPCLCFNYNLGSASQCRDAEQGQQCSRGWHLCTRIRCAKPQSHFRCELPDWSVVFIQVFKVCVGLAQQFWHQGVSVWRQGVAMLPPQRTFPSLLFSRNRAKHCHHLGTMEFP